MDTNGAGIGAPQQALAWRVEQACLNAWPSLGSVLVGDWLLRFGDGLSRRANSVNPIRPDVTTIAPQLNFFGRSYRDHSLPLIVRLPSLLPPQVERELEHRGFTAEGETCALYRTLGDDVFASDPDITIRLNVDAEWLAALERLQQQSPAQALIYARVVAAIALPTAFLTLRRDGVVVAAAYGVLHDDLLVCESVVVDAAVRRQGFGRRLMQSLFAWAISRGATAVCLQLVADNNAARTLYAGLGFDYELYRYHYRRAPQ